MKKAMPFVQNLKKRLVAGEAPETIFERKLAFNEEATLKNMVPGLKKAAGLTVVEIIRVDEGGKTGTIIDGEAVQNLPAVAEAAVPGVPTFAFENVAV